jgi:opacity protein-like surface antigen
MFSVKFLISAAAAAMLSTTAFAADMPQPQPVYQPVVEPCCSGAWYLRGDIGVGILSKSDLVFEQNPLNSSNFKIQHSSIDDTTFFMAGVGYEYNNWLRFDVTGEYRTKAEVNAFGLYNNAGVFGDSYTGSIRSTVLLANGYIDLGTWNCLTPFIGAGVGVAFNTLGDFTDIGIGTSGSGAGGNPTEAHLAWALHAGLSYAVTQNFSVELAYRYLNYGSITDTIYCTGGCNPDSYKFQNLSSNDFMLGFRWRFPIESGVVTSMPVMMQQPVAVQPAPPMPPPPQYPLSTRG